MTVNETRTNTKLTENEIGSNGKTYAQEEKDEKKNTETVQNS